VFHAIWLVDHVLDEHVPEGNANVSHVDTSAACWWAAALSAARGRRRGATISWKQIKFRLERWRMRRRLRAVQYEEWESRRRRRESGPLAMHRGTR
jgi:hypothetical protein